MKRFLSMLMVVLLLFGCMLAEVPEVHASTKTNESRAIAIVFDNSGSMYESGNQAWCRATYAMEVFASMLNTGDVLQIYPMWPITVGSQTYTMESPLQITDASQASVIRDIFTEDAGGTPIESIDCAAIGLQAVQADKKYMIVLTDGGTFSKNGSGLSKDRTRNELDNRIEQYAGTEITVMYLGIGSAACMPNVEETEHFVKKHAVNTEDVLSSLTVMCNQIFGRDTLPKDRISGNSMEFDISMSKLIVFVQGDDISNLKITGSTVGEQIGAQQTKYSTMGAGDYPSVPDESLQGMMVTYADCAPGTYNIDYSGTASNVEVYYEPDADLDFVFTDANGNTAHPNAIYDGDYKVSFGIKDAKTGKLISSDLLGTPHYEGSYFINGVETVIELDGQSGEIPVTLNVGDNLEATLTVTYLSGYTITKNTEDFGWPIGGITAVVRSAGELRLEIFGGAESYSLQYLEEGAPLIAEVYYEGSKVTGKELEKVDLKWKPETSNAEIMETFADDHYDLSLHYKDTTAPQNTVCGECTVTIYAYYTPKGHSEAVAECIVTYNIIDDFSPLQINLYAEQDFFIIPKMDDSKPLVVEMLIDGNQLTAADFESIRLDVLTDGIDYELTPNAENACYELRLLSTPGIEEGKYPIVVTATHTDHIGRETISSDSLNVTLSSMALWLKWLIGTLALLLLILIIWLILHIKMFPKYVRQLTNECYMGLNGKDVSSGTDFKARLNGKTLIVRAEYGGQTVGINLGELRPGPNGVLCKPSHKRNISVANPTRINMTGDLTQADINGVLYVVDKTTGKLMPEDETQRPYLLANAAMISFDGRIEDGGRTKKFHADVPLTFKKK